MYYDDKGKLITDDIKWKMLYDKYGNFIAFNPIDKSDVIISKLFERLTKDDKS